jgi:Kelch motif protein
VVTTAELYDPSSGTFSPTGSLLIARSGHTATLLPSGQVFFVGGVPGPTEDNPSVQIDPTTEIYDPSAARFSYAGKMISPRIRQTATSLTNGTVLIVGGWTTDQAGDYNTTPSAEIYDPVTSSFSPAGDLAWSRGFHSSVALANGSVLVTGGTFAQPPGPPVVLNSAEIYK